jgi:hypothetical protein
MENTVEVKPVIQEIIRNPDGTFPKGVSGNPNGRPKGKTLKEWVRDRLMTMTDEERVEFLKTVPLDVQWKMAEGMPHQTGEIEAKGEVKIIFDGAFNGGNNETTSKAS